MPELETPTAPPSAPAASPVVDSPGSSSLVGDLMAGIESGDAVESAPAPEAPKAAPAAAPKAPEKAAEKPPTKAEEKKADIADAKKTEKDPVKLRERLAQIEKEYGDFKNTHTTTVGELNKKIKELSSVEKWTPEKQARIDELEKRKTELESDLYSRDYRVSPEYKEQFVEKWNKTHKNALAQVVGSTVMDVGEDGVTQTPRKITAEDFQRVLTAPPSEQFDLADKIFGKKAHLVLTSVTALKQIEDAAEEAVNTRRANYDKEQAAKAQNNQKLGQTMKSVREQTHKELAEKFPQFFGDDAENPKSNELMQKGYELFDQIANKNQPPEQRAMKMAVARAWTAAFPRMAAQAERDRTTISELRAEIAKYRGSDPGTGGDAPPPSPKPEDGAKGSQDLAAAFDK